MAKPSKNMLPTMVAFLLGAATATVFFLTACTEWGSVEGEALKKQGRPLLVTAGNNKTCVTQGNKTTAEHKKTRFSGSSLEIESADDELAKMLAKAAMDDDTVILTSVNEAYGAPGALLELFLKCFRIGENTSHLINHIIIIAVDRKGYQYCKSMHPYCYFLRQEGLNLSSENRYMTRGYINLLWSKIKVQQRILELGYNFLFTDMDVAWFRNPFGLITLAPHISVSCDFYFGDPDNMANFLNTGFIYFKACKKNIRVMDYWHKSRTRYPDNHEQFAFNEIKHELVSNFGARIKFLDTAQISGFCQLGRDLSRIYAVHLTCCVGLGTKLHDLRRIMKDWEHYMSRPLWERHLGNMTWTFQGGICIH